MDIRTMDTRAFIQEFLDSLPDSTREKVYRRIDRPEVYKYEEKIGKKLLEMDVDDLFGLILEFESSKVDNPRSISYLSYESLASTYRHLWDYYSDNYELIRNPWNNPAMKGTNAKKRLAKLVDVFNKEKFDDLIKKIREYYDGENEIYIECIVLLYYDGFADTEEIIGTKEHMINSKTATVYLPNKTIHLSDRCFSLLRHINSLDEVPGWRGDFKMVSYHDSYLKFAVRPSNVSSFQDTELRSVKAKITQVFSIKLAKDLGITVAPRTIYLLGFYERMKAKFGYERTKELICSLRNAEENQMLMDFARENGGYFVSVTSMKNYLIPFVESDTLNV